MPDPASAPAAAALTPPAASPTPITTEPQTVQTTIPAAASPAVKPDDRKVSFFESIPTEYKNKPYLKDVQTFEQLYKKLDGAEELIGKRPAGIPGPDAKPEEKDAFFKSWGRPDKPDGYKFVDVKLPEGVIRNEELSMFAKDLFHKAGLAQWQVDIIQGGYEGKALELVGKAAPDAAAIEAEFESLIDKQFGDKKDVVLKNGRALLSENTPKELQPHLASLDNKALLVLSAVLENVRAKYISDDALPLDAGSPYKGVSVDDLRQQARELMAKPEYTNKSHRDHAKIADEVQGIYEQIKRLQSRGGK